MFKHLGISVLIILWGAVGLSEGYRDGIERRREKKQEEKVLRQLNEEVEAHPLTLGLGTCFGYNLGKVKYSSDASSGLMLGASLEASYRLSPDFRLLTSVGYGSLSLSRKVQVSGEVSDPNTTEFKHSLKVITVLAEAGYAVWAPREEMESFSLWMQAGLEGVLSLSANQTDNSGFPSSNRSFSSQDKFLFLVLGPAFDLPLNRSVTLISRLEMYYNLGAAQGSGLMGGRGAVAVHLAL